MRRPYFDPSWFGKSPWPTAVYSSVHESRQIIHQMNFTGLEIPKTPTIPAVLMFTASNLRRVLLIVRAGVAKTPKSLQFALYQNETSHMQSC